MVTAALATALPRASMTVPSRAPSAVLAFEAAGKTPIKKRARTGRKIFMTDFKAILALAAGGFSASWPDLFTKCNLCGWTDSPDRHPFYGKKLG